MQYPNMYFFMSFVSLFSHHEMDIATDIEVGALASTLRFYDRLVDNRLLEDGCDQSCARQKFIKGEVAYLIDGDWALGELKQAMTDDLAISALPSYQSKPMRSLSGGKALIFSKQAMQNPLKRTALKEMALMVQQSEFVDQVIIGQNLISANAKLNELSFYSFSTYYSQLYSELEPAVIMPSSVTMAIFWEAINQGIKRYQLGMPAEEAATFVLDFVADHLVKIKGLSVEGVR
jgi:maltose-binding protein MalE